MDANAEIQRAYAEAKRKKSASARAILRNVLAAEPSNVDAWMAFAIVAQKPEHAVQCLEQAARLDPANEKVQRMLADLQDAHSSGKNSPKSGTQNPTAKAAQPGVGLSDDLVEEPLASMENVHPAARTPGGLSQPTSTSRLVSEQSSPAKSGRTAETVLLVILAGVVCVVVALLGVVYIPRLPVVSSLFQAKPTPAASEITATIYANIDASNAEDITAYMATIHSHSPVHAQTESMLSPMFAQYDLSFRMTNLDVIEQTEKEARVAFVLVTRKIRGPEFRDNQVTGVMILRPENGAWKIYNQEVDAIEYLK